MKITLNAKKKSHSIPYPNAPCMEYLPTFPLKITQMSVNIPYMEHMGYKTLNTLQNPMVFHHFFHIFPSDLGLSLLSSARRRVLRPGPRRRAGRRRVRHVGHGAAAQGAAPGAARRRRRGEKALREDVGGGQGGWILWFIDVYGRYNYGRYNYGRYNYGCLWMFMIDIIE